MPKLPMIHPHVANTIQDQYVLPIPYLIPKSIITYTDIMYAQFSCVSSSASVQAQTHKYIYLHLHTELHYHDNQLRHTVAI